MARTDWLSLNRRCRVSIFSAPLNLPVWPDKWLIRLLANYELLSIAFWKSATVEFHSLCDFESRQPELAS